MKGEVMVYGKYFGLYGGQNAAASIGGSYLGGVRLDPYMA